MSLSTSILWYFSCLSSALLVLRLFHLSLLLPWFFFYTSSHSLTPSHISPHICNIIVLVPHWCCHNPSWSLSIYPRGNKEKGLGVGKSMAYSKWWQRISFPCLWSVIKVQLKLYDIFSPTPARLNTDRPPVAASDKFVYEHPQQHVVYVFISIPISQLRANKPKCK